MKQKFVYGVIAIIVAMSVFAIGWKASQISQNSAKMSSSSNEEQNGSFSGVQRDEWKSLVDFVPDANVDYKVSQFLKKYLVINACPQEFAPCRDLLFDLQSRKEIKMEFPSPMGKILISADEKYAAFIGMGSFSQPGVSIEVADGKKVYCLLSEDEVTDVEIRDGTISFREYSLGEPVGDKNAGMEKSFNIKDACQEIKFDACGKLEKYKNESWYQDVLGKLKDENQPIGGVFDVCQSLDKSLVILLTNGHSEDELIPYCQAGLIYRYDVIKQIFDKAVFNDKGRGCVAWPSEFGKRTGDTIALQGSGGDAGCSSNMYYSYEFVDNVIQLTKECSLCSGESRESCREFTSGDTL